MEDCTNGMSVQYSVKQNVTLAVEDSTGSKRMSGTEAVGESWSSAMLKELWEKDLIVGLEELRSNMLCYEELWPRKKWIESRSLTRLYSHVKQL
jgi:hypothetical protein